MKSSLFPVIIVWMLASSVGFTNPSEQLTGSSKPMEKGLFSHFFNVGMQHVLLLLEQPAFDRTDSPKEQRTGIVMVNLSDMLTGPDDISGKVWEDWNFNGIMDEIDTIGVGGVTVNLYDCNANLIGTTTTDVAGDYILNNGNTTFTTNEDEIYRLEFNPPTEVLNWAVPTPTGADNGTSVQFLQKGDIGNYGLAAPYDFCQDDPFLVTNCFIEGDNSGSGDVLISYAAQSPTTFNHESIASQIGTTYGLAYQRASNSVFASSFMKRFAGLGGSPGSIFIVTNPADGMTSGTEFVNLNNLFGPTIFGVDPHNFIDETSNGDVIDSLAFSAVGKLSFGDLDISVDERSLWVVNLFDRSLYNIPLGDDPANPVAPSSPFQVSIIPTVDGDIASPNPLPDLPAGITNNEIRPFGLKVKGNYVYVGLVTNGEDGGPLIALVYAYDTGSQTFNKVLEFSLEYDRGCALAVGNDCAGSANWNAWTDIYPASPAMVRGNEHAHPQPMLSDIEFDAHGNMILGLRDRFGDQTGFQVPLPDGGTALRIGDGLGDIVLATWDGANSWAVDTSDFRDATQSIPANAATETELFFGEDYYVGNNDLHEETASGGLAVLPGTNTVVTTNVDPLVSFSAGVDWFNTHTGQLTNSFELLAQQAQFNKANGLGEVEAICQPAPIEIGNYVWEDLNGDGIQNACEPGLSGVNVDLYDGSGNHLAFTMTNGDGQYYFSRSDAPGQVWSNGTDSVEANSMYFIVVGKGQFTNDFLMANGDDFTLTQDSVNSGNNRFLRDSDGSIAANIAAAIDGFPFTKTTTDDWGNADHSLDFGFYDCLPDSTVFNELICEGDSYFFDGQDISVSGNYRDTLLTVDGCDSVLVLHLTVQPVTEITLDEDICEGENYFFDGQLLTQSGTYRDTTFYSTGCDSIRTQLNLTVRNDCSEPVFDLALRKTLATNQSRFVTAGETVKFRVYIFNQGDFDAFNILVVDYLPIGFDFNAAQSQGWLNFGAGPTWFVPFLPAGGVDSLDIAFNLNANATDGDLFNYAEITSADDDFNGSNTPPNDVDSTPNALVSDDPGGTPGTPADDVITGDGTGAIGSNDPLTDEDDHDGEEVILTAPVLSLGNQVFLDLENDGLFNNNDTGIEGVEVELYEAGPDELANTADDIFIGMDETDVLGQYLFENLIGGYYYVKLNGTGLPVGYRSSTGDGVFDNDGSGAYDPAPSPDDNLDNRDDGTQMLTMIVSGLIELSLNEEPGGNQNLTLDFGLYAPQMESLTLGDLVFHDQNNDGVFNDDDYGISDVQVALFDLGSDGAFGTADDNQLSTILTNGDGEYEFVDLEEGSYYVKLTGVGIPTDFISSTGEGVTDDDGSGPYEPYVGTDNNINGEDDGTQMGTMILSDVIELTFGDEVNDGDDNSYRNPSVDFGLYLPEETPTVGVGNLVFYDEDNDGQFNGNDVGLEDVEVILLYPGPDGLPGTADDEPVDTMLTNGFGEYQFRGLVDSTYFIKLSGVGIPTDYLSSTGDGIFDMDTSGVYEPAPGSDANIDGVDDGTQMGGMIISSVFNLAVGTETGDGDSDPNFNPSVDFGFYLPQDPPVFDLALRKTLAAGQADLVELGDFVTFTITVFNQGTANAFNVLVVDYLPIGYTFNALASPGWVDFGAGPSWFIPGPLLPGDSISLDITMVVNNSALPGAMQNYAEISSADDDSNGSNTPPTDIDSSPDAFFGNDAGGTPGLPADNAIDGDGSGAFGSNDPLTDEDDMDGAEVALDIPTLLLGNLVFADYDNDGIFNNSDEGLSGVTLELYEVGADGEKGSADDEYVDTKISNSIGEYVFQIYAEGLYYVKLTGDGIPTDYVSSTGEGINDPDAAGPFEPATGTDTNVDGTDDGTQMGAMVMSDTIRLSFGNEPTGPENNENLTVDFGLYEPVILTIVDIGNQVFHDENNDGIFNNNEQGIAEVEVQLFDLGPDGEKGTNDDSEIATTLTDEFGEYLFIGVEQGVYYVKLSGVGIPVDFVSSTGDGIYDDDGDGAFEPSLGTDNNLDGLDDGTQMGDMVMSDTIRLMYGEEPGFSINNTVDFGLYQPQPEPTNTLGNLVFADLDNDGVFNGDDYGLEDVEVKLMGLGPDGEKGTSDDIELVTTFTNEFGEYQFSGLPEDVYYVKLSGAGIPFGWISSTGDGIFDVDGAGPFEPSLGTDNNFNNIDDGTQMGAMIMSDTIRLTWFSEPEIHINNTVDFGLYEMSTMSLGNLVFFDNDNDGTFNNNDEGIADVEVILFEAGPDGEKGTNDDVQISSQMTDGSGGYLFTGLEEGLFYVLLTGEGIPANYTSSTGDGIYDMDNAGAFEPSLGTDDNVDNDDDGTQMNMAVMSDTIRLQFNSEPDGNSNLTVDFGFYEPQEEPTNSLGDLVFADVDNNGFFNGADYGIEEVEVKLMDLGPDGEKGTIDDVELDAVLTDSNGNYQFTGLAQGVYYVKLSGEGIPENWISSTGQGIFDLDGAGPFEPSLGTDGDFNNVDDGTQMGTMVMSDTVRLTWFDEPEIHDNNTVDFGLYEPQFLQLGDLVFYDYDNDGIFNNNDEGMEDVEVTLFSAGPDGKKGTADDVQVASQMTDSLGAYLFSELLEGLYYVQLPGPGIPADYVSSTGDGIYDMDGAGIFEPSLGTDDNTDGIDDGTQMNGVVMSDTIRLNYNQEPEGNTNNSVDFGFYEPQDEPTLTLGNLVFADLNNNGAFEGSDYGLEEVEVTLFNVGADGEKGTNDDLEITTVTTDGFGNYQFTGLAQGVYYVKLSGVGIPEEWVSSTGQGIYDLDGAGPFEPSLGTDNNQDQVDDGTQMGSMIMSDTIRLTIFEEPDTHVNNTVDFGFYEPQSLKLGNLVFYDHDNDGIFNNNDAGIEDVEVILFSVGADGEKGTVDDVQLSSQMTDGFGEYLFTELVEGLYYVQLSGIGIPADYVSSTGDGVFDMDGAGAFEPALGTDGNVDHDDDGTQMNTMVMSDTIRLTLNEEPDGNTNTTVDFGFYLPQVQPTLSLGNLVFHDLDNDGVFNNDDSGIEDVEIILYSVGPDGEKGTNDDVEIASQLTNAAGEYFFIGINEGLYYVKLSGIGIPADFVSSTGDGIYDMDADGAFEPALGTDANVDGEDDGTQMGIMVMSDTIRLTLGEEPDGDVNLTVDFGLYEPQPLPILALGNQVFLDMDNDGFFNNNDTGIVNVEVLLFNVGADGEKGTNDDLQVASQNTDSAGEYQFTDLAEGLYYVKLSGTGLSPSLVSSTGDGPFDMDLNGAFEPFFGTDNNVDNDDDGTQMGTMFMSDTIRLTSNGEPDGNTNNTVDFGLYEPQTPSNFEIGNLVFHDFDNDGLFNNNDTGIVNVEVALYKLGNDGLKGTADDILITAQLTDSNGNYLFINQSEDLFYVKLTGQGIPVDFVSSTGEGIYDDDGSGPFEPSLGTDNNVDNQDDGTQMGMMIMSDTIRLTNNDEPEGNTNRTVDFGLYAPQEQIFHELGNLVFHDLDNDGLFNNNDTGLVNVEVALYKLGNDGIKGTNDDVLVTAQLTDSNGNYLFVNQSADLFYVKLTGFGIPADFVSSTGEGIYDQDASGPYEPFIGTDLNVDDEDDGTQMGSMVMSDTIRLTDNNEPDGSTNLTVDFGLYEPQDEPTNSLGNLVFEDFDNDGIFNNNDLGINGVEVELYALGPDGMKATNDDVLIGMTNTDPDGAYLFDELEEGVYYVKLNGNGIPANYVSSTGEGVFDQDGSGPFEPIFGTDNNVDNQDDGTQMGSMIMSDTIRLTKFGEPEVHINNTVDFGLYEPQTVPTLSLGNLVFDDQDNNGFFNNDDIGLADIEVKLFDVGPDSLKNTIDDIELASQMTNGQGGYFFTGISEGLYYVKLTGVGVPANYVTSTGDGRFDNDGSGPFEPSLGTDNNVDNQDDGTQMGSMIMSDTIRLKLNTEPDGNVNTTVDFGLYLPLEYASVGDRVWIDLDENGQQNEVNTGVPDVSLGLFDLGADNLKGTNDDNLIGSEQTDATGFYSFTGIEPGNYYVMIDLATLPANYILSGQDQGADATDNDFNQMGMTDVFNLSSGEDNPTVDAGIRPEKSSLGNYVWIDLDRDGQQGINEPPVPDLTVHLFDLGNDGLQGGGDDNLLSSTMTNSNGLYLFDELNAGSYYVIFDISTFIGTYSPTSQDVGNDVSDSDANSIGVTEVILLGVGEHNETIDFGLEPELASLGDLVWFDTDRDGQKDITETGVPDLTVNLFDLGPDGVKGTNDDAMLDTDVTNSDGFYSFASLEPGVYYVMFDLGLLSDSYIATQQNNGNDNFDSDANAMGMTDEIVLSPGETNTTIDFGIEPKFASLGGFVWFDDDVDGQQENGEAGVPNVLVKLFDLGDDGQKGGGDDQEIGAQLTTNDGTYTFTDLEPGDYYVQFDVSTFPANYFTTTQNVGNNITDSDANNMGMTEVVSLPPGDDSQMLDVGIYDPMFDLALDKSLAPGQANMVDIGDEIHYQITIKNEGLTDAYNVVVTDHIPSGLAFSASNTGWTLVNADTAKFTIPGPILPGEEVVLDIFLVVRFGLSNSTLTNVAEVSSATDVNNITVTDVDSTPNNDVPTEDDFDDEEITLLEHDPTGWIYCEKTGRIITGGTITVTGPNGIPNDEVQILSDGASGYYEFYAVGATGTYTIQYNHPDGYPFSMDCLPGGTFDPPNGGGAVTLGSIATNGFLQDTSCAANPYYFDFDLELGDPPIYANNFPVQCGFIGSIVCEDTNNNDQVDASDQLIVGATVNLYDCSDLVNPIATVLTDANGRYVFDGLIPGNYLVGYELPNGTRFVSNGTMNTNGFSDCISLNWGDCDTSKVICLYNCPAVTADDRTICFGDSAQLLATVPYGSGIFSWIPPNDLDNSNIANPVASPSATTTYLVTYSDGLGCLDSDDATVNVSQTAPYLTYTPFANQSVECDQPVPFEAPVFADDCDADLMVTLDSVIIAPGCGVTIERTWTATNAQGNSTIFTQVVNVVDNTPPVMMASHPLFGEIFHGDTLYADCLNIPSLDSLGFSAWDYCCATTRTFEENVTRGDCEADGFVERRYCGWTATDCCGNTDSLYFTIFVQDTTAPVLSSVPANVTVDCGNIPAIANVTANDACSGPAPVVYDEMIWGDSTAGCYLIMRTWTATDSCGNMASASQNVLVQDFTPPVLQNVPASGLADCGNLGTPNVTALDNCDGIIPVILTENLTSDSNGCVTQVDRTWTAFDGCGNMAFATQTLVVENDDVPQITVTHPMFAGNQHGDSIYVDCDQVAVLSANDATATADCCGAPTIEFHEFVSNGNCPTDGYLATMICGWTATDCCGNVDSLFLTIIVVDNAAPVLQNIPANMSYACVGSAPMPAMVFATDNCDDNVEIAFAETTEFVNGQVQTTRTWTAVDDCGNTDEQSQLITYTQENAPFILNVPADITVPTTADIPAPSANVTAGDDCDPAPALTVMDEPTGGGCCYFITRTWTATDNYGLQATASQVITVQDTEPPVISGVADDVTDECSFDEIFVSPVSVSDNCTPNPVVIFTQDTVFNSCFYEIIRTWTATDECGNMAIETQNITVSDTEPPTTYAFHPFFGEIQHGDVLFADCSQIPSLDSIGFSSTDNCGGPVTRTFEENVNQGNCLTDGFVEARYCGWTVTDPCGNTDSLFFSVIVSDNDAPVLSGIPASVTVDCNNVPPNDAIVTATDNCQSNIQVMMQEDTISYSCPDTYTLERKWMAADSCGNLVMDSQIITVIDDTPPNMFAIHPFFGEIQHGDTLFATCSQIPSLDSIGFAAIDICSAVTRTFEEEVTRGNCLTDGFVEERFCGWTVSDACGNTDSLFFTVIITDNEAPVLSGVPADVTVACDSVPANDALVTVADNCYDDLQIVMTTDSIPGSCSSSYVLRRSWSATDSCGNHTSQTQIITVINETPPSLFAFHSFFGEIFHGDTLYADCTQIPSLDSLGFETYDDCCETTRTFEENVEQGDCETDGFIEKRYCGWTSTDCCGNTDSLYFTVFVRDLEGPMITGVPLDTNVICGNIPDLSDVTVTDNCTDNPFFYSVEYFSRDFCPFTITRVWIAEDDCGNVSTDTQFIFVFEEFELDFELVHPLLADVSDGDTITVECNDPITFDADDAEVMTNCSGLLDYTFDEDFVAFGDCDEDGFIALLSNTWSASDECGHDTSITVFLKYVDTRAPIFSNLPADTIIHCGDEIPDFTAPDVEDECGDITLEIIDSTIVAADGEIRLRTWNAIDECGNSSRFTQAIMVMNTQIAVLENITVSPEICDDENGTASVFVNGEESEFGFQWLPDLGENTDSVGNSRVNLPAGDYQVIVFDGPCRDTFELTVLEECDCVPPTVDSLTISTASCGAADASATIHIAENLDEYSFTWIPDQGNPLAAGNSRTELMSGHYVVIIVHNNDNSCVSTVEFDVFDDCLRCGPMFDEVAFITQMADSQLTEVCLPVPFGVAIGMDIYLDGQTYNHGIQACDEKDVIAYDYSIVSGMGQSGTYSVVWEHYGKVFSTVVENLDELAAKMSQVDVFGDWYNDRKAFQLVSTNLTGDYSGLYLFDIDKEEHNYLPAIDAKADMGTTFEISAAHENVLMVNPINDCSDLLLLNLTVEPSISLFAVDTLELAVNCSNNVFDYCLDLPLSEFDEFTFTLNNEPVDDILTWCGLETKSFYSLGILQSVSFPFTLDEWIINGQSFAMTFYSFEQLAEAMDQWDTTGDWWYNPLTIAIEGGNPASDYSTMVVIKTEQGNDFTYTFPSNQITSPSRRGISLEPGIHQLTGIHQSTGAVDEQVIILACVNTANESISIEVGEEEEFCLDVSGLPGNINSNDIEICGSGDHSIAQVETITGTFCLEVEGLADGATAFCLVACDDLDFCDTTYLSVNVGSVGPTSTEEEKLETLRFTTHITPDGDGISDQFIIHGIENMHKYQLTIVDQLGRVLLRTDDYRNNWNGSYQNGQMVSGVYFYLLETQAGYRSGQILVIN
ncbi:MAG: SdrD B-like domain-containing protein [Bacteroidota bacterium]